MLDVDVIDRVNEQLQTVHHHVHQSDNIVWHEQQVVVVVIMDQREGSSLIQVMVEMDDVVIAVNGNVKKVFIMIVNIISV